MFKFELQSGKFVHCNYCDQKEIPQSNKTLDSSPWSRSNTLETATHACSLDRNLRCSILLHLLLPTSTWWFSAWITRKERHAFGKDLHPEEFLWKRQSDERRVNYISSVCDHWQLSNLDQYPDLCSRHDLGTCCQGEGFKVRSWMPTWEFASS